MWIVLMTAIALPLAAGILLLRVRLHSDNLGDSEPHMHL